MLPGSHFFVASALSLKFTSEPWLAFSVGFISHHFLDFLPHLDMNIFRNEKYRSIKNWDLKVYFLLISEFLFFIILTFYFLGNFSLEKQKIALLGGLGSLFPDIITLFINSFLSGFNYLNFYLRFHKNFHFKLENKFLSYFSAILTQLFIIFLTIFIFNSLNYY